MKGFFIIAIILLGIAFTINMLMHVLNSKMSILAKIIWSFVILTTTLAGATLYFISDHGRSYNK